MVGGLLVYKTQAKLELKGVLESLNGLLLGTFTLTFPFGPSIRTEVILSDSSQSLAGGDRNHHWLSGWCFHLSKTNFHPLLGGKILQIVHQVIQAVPFSSPILGGHVSNLSKRSPFLVSICR